MLPRVERREQRPVKTGSIIRPPFRPEYSMAVLPGENRYWYTHGHGPGCQCRMCLTYFENPNGGRLPIRRLDSAFSYLLKERILQPFTGDTTPMQRRPVGMMSRGRKLYVNRDLDVIVKEMDAWIIKHKGLLREYQARNQRTFVESLPDVRMIILDESGLISRNSVCQYTLDLAPPHVPQAMARDLHHEDVYPERGDLWEQTLVISLEGVSFASSPEAPGMDTLKNIEETIHVLQAYNQARMITAPMKLFIIAGQTTIEEEGTQAAEMLYQFIRESIYNGHIKITWLGTGVGKPLTETRQYREFARLLSQMMRTPTEAMMNAYDVFHGRYGDSAGRLTGSHVRESYVQQLRGYLLTSDPYHLPPWAAPRYQDGYDHGDSRRRARGRRTKRIEKRAQDIRKKILEVPSCHSCEQVGHTTQSGICPKRTDSGLPVRNCAPVNRARQKRMRLERAARPSSVLERDEPLNLQGLFSTREDTDEEGEAISEPTSEPSVYQLFGVS